MAGTIARLNVEIGGDIRNMMKSFDRAEREMRSSGQRLVNLGNNLASTLSVALGGAAVGAVKFGGEMESMTLAMRATFENAGRSIRQADAEVNALRKSAQAPGLDFDQALAASIRFQAVGYSASSARRTIEGLANTIATTGGTAANLNSVTVQMGQMISKGKVLSADLRIIQENMPIVSRLMEQAFGTSNAEKLQELGITGKEFVDKITVEMAKLPKVSGGISNALVNIGTGIKNFLGNIGQDIAKAFDLTNKAEGFTSMLEKASQYFSGLSDGTKRLVFEMGLALVAIGPVVKVMGTLQLAGAQLISIWGGLVSASKPLQLFFAGLTQSTGSVTGYMKSFAESMLGAGQAAARMRVLAAGAMLGLVGVLAGVAAAVYLTADRFDAAEFAASKFSDAQKQIIADTSKETAIMNANFATLKSDTASRNEKRAAVDALQKQYPQYLGNIDLEKASVSELTNLQRGLNDQILRSVAERQKVAAVTAVYEKQAQIMLRIQQLKNGAQVSAGEASLIDTGDMLRAGSISAAVISKMEQQVQQLGTEAGNLANQFDAAFGTVKRSIDPATQAQYDAMDAYYQDRDAIDDLSKKTSHHVVTQKESTSATRDAAKASRDKAKADQEQWEEMDRITDGLVAQNEASERLRKSTEVTPIPLGGEKNALGTTQFGVALPGVEHIAGFDEKKTEDLKKRLQGLTQPMKEITELGQLMRDAFEVAAKAVGDTAAAGDLSFKKLAASALKAAGQVIGAWIRQGVAGAVSKALQGLPFPLNIAAGAAAGGIAYGLFNKALSSLKVPGYAAGTDFHPGGLAMVGERGPELVKLPRASAVIPNSQLSATLSKGGTMTHIVTGTLRAQGSEILVAIENAQRQEARRRGYGG